jgi:methylated-DNA-protein-cysteine methyltransferase-like protein
MVARLVPHGRVTSYGAIARYLGSPQSSRMVGWALNSCHGANCWVPAHRVVNRIGMLTGKHHFPGRNTMQQLLESEGIRVVDDRVIDFEKLFWDPNKELTRLLLDM